LNNERPSLEPFIKGLPFFHYVALSPNLYIIYREEYSKFLPIIDSALLNANSALGTAERPTKLVYAMEYVLMGWGHFCHLFHP
jgi:hypothetical protein